MSEPFFAHRPPSEQPPLIPEENIFPKELEKYLFIVNDKRVFEDILETAHKNWPGLEEGDKAKFLRYLEDLRTAIQNYQERCGGLRSVSSMRFEDPEKTKEAIIRSDARRRAAHDSLIDSLNILSRHMKELGLSNSWRARDSIYTPSEEGMRLKISKWAQEISLGEGR